MKDNQRSVCILLIADIIALIIGSYFNIKDATLYYQLTMGINYFTPCKYNTIKKILWIISRLFIGNVISLNNLHIS